MAQYCIYAKPNVDGVEEIQRLRESFDPLAEKVDPHITLVFPFVTEMDQREIIRHVDEVTRHQKKIKIALCPPETIESYAFYPVSGEDNQLDALFESLNSGVLASFRLDIDRFVPHITFGRYGDRAKGERMRLQAQEIYNGQTGYLDTITLEEIDPSCRGLILQTWLLN